MLTKPRVSSKPQTTSMYTGKRRRRISPLMLAGMSVPLVLALIAGAVFVLPRLASHAATANPNCSLLVPNNPLTAKGLATPYQLSATDAAQGPCNEANADQAAFVQATIIDPATGAVSVYNPLVIDKGTQPAIKPVVPTLPANAVVGIWFGYNGDVLTLRGGLVPGKCVNGIRGSNFGQFAYCNAPAFFQAANKAIKAGQLTVPSLGMAKDGMPCMTTRDFGLVDMDQSDNVLTTYLTTANGQIAQNTAANAAKLKNAQTSINGSDNRLLDAFEDAALGCQPWMAPDLADPGNMVSSLPLNELQAAAFQGSPVAVVPAGDPMVLDNNGNPNLNKLNAYRVGVDQAQVNNLNQASTKTYCQNMIKVGAARIQLDKQFTQNAPTPDAGTGNTLFTFLAARFTDAIGTDGLNCTGILNIQPPFKLTTNADGVVVDAALNTGANNNGNGGANNTTTNNGGVQQIATGTAQFNFESNERSVGVQLNITYPKHGDQAVNMQVHTDSCTGNTIFNQREDLEDNGTNDADTVINNVNNTATIPTNWFFVVVDPQQNNTAVGCGSVVPSGVGTQATATLGTVLTVAQMAANVQKVSATGTATFEGEAGENSVNFTPNVTYVLRPNQAVNVQIRTGSCTGPIVFDHRTDLNAQDVNDDDTVINNVAGSVIPNNWFYTVADPQQTGANGQPVQIGCGIVKSTGMNATATLGVTQ